MALKRHFLLKNYKNCPCVVLHVARRSLFIVLLDPFDFATASAQYFITLVLQPIERPS